MFEVEFTSKIPESQGNWEIQELFASSVPFKITLTVNNFMESKDMKMN